MKDNFAFIEHILEAIEKIESYLEGVDFEKFFKSDLIFDAVVREIEIIGEASNNISDDFRKKYSDIP